MKFFKHFSVLALHIHRKQQLHAVLLFSFICFVVPSISAAQTRTSDANALMQHIDKMWRSDSSHVLISMKVKTSRYERTMKLESWSKGKEHSLIIIRSPKKDRDIATLKVGENIWNYLPKINRVTKVPASMMSGSWMGSHFTNDDLVKENTYEDDFTSTITFDGERNGHTIVEVTSTPHPNAAVVWGKVVTQIDKKNSVPISAIYFDEDNSPVRKMIFDRVTTQGDRIYPARLTLTPVDKPEESTVVEYLNMEFDLPLRDQLFSLRSLQKKH